MNVRLLLKCEKHIVKTPNIPYKQQQSDDKCASRRHEVRENVVGFTFILNPRTEFDYLGIRLLCPLGRVKLFSTVYSEGQAKVR